MSVPIRTHGTKTKFDQDRNLIEKCLGHPNNIGLGWEIDASKMQKIRLFASEQPHPNLCLQLQEVPHGHSSKR